VISDKRLLKGTQGDSHVQHSSLSTGYGFNPGSALLLPDAESTSTVAARAAANTALSAAFGGLSGLFTNMASHHVDHDEKSFSLEATMNGALAGLVGITGACGTVELWASALIGIVSGWIYVFGAKLLIRWKVDDVVKGVPVHAFSGAWSLVATGLFSSPSAIQESFGTDEYAGWFYELGRGSTDATLLTNQLIAMLGIIAWTTGLMLPFFLWLNRMGWLKADDLEQVIGLDIKYMQDADGAKEEAQADLGAYRKEVERSRRRRRERSKSLDTLKQANSVDTLNVSTDTNVTGV